MPIDLVARKLHDPTDPEIAAMLAKLQGNILKGHGRRHTAHVFLKFKDGVSADAIRQVLKPLMPRYVTSAAVQRAQAAAFREKKKTGLFGSFLLTRTGYDALGFSSQQLDQAFLFEAVEPELAAPVSFKLGMKAAGATLRDRGRDDWEAPFQGRIDALFLLAHSDEAALKTSEGELRQALAAVADPLTTEWGRVLLNDKEEGIEAFGYVDGRSQPLFLQGDLPAGEETTEWDPVAALGLVLFQDRTVDEPDAFGSFYVFRKLEQDVAGFRARETALATELQLSDEDRDRAGAMAVGRFRDGTPLQLSGKAGHSPAQDNNFRFKADAGLRCPYHAHIRKVNPRGDTLHTGGPDSEERRRIARRGIPYGKTNAGDSPVGLLFGCFQSSIAKQFAFIQANWANEPTFARAGTGLDPLIASSLPNEENGAQQWPVVWDKAPPDEAQHPSIDFGNFVTLQGGEFFFAPSIPFLAKLAP